MESLSLFNLFSAHLWHSLVLYCSDTLAGVISSLSKLFLLCCFTISETLNWQQLFFPLFTRKAFSKKELLIRNRSVLIWNTRESRTRKSMHRRRLVRMCISWQQNIFPLLCHIWVFSRKETEFGQSILLLFGGFPLQDSALIILCQIT